VQWRGQCDDRDKEHDGSVLLAPGSKVRMAEAGMTSLFPMNCIFLTC
jgi:hypothetical protein